MSLTASSGATSKPTKELEASTRMFIPGSAAAGELDGFIRRPDEKSPTLRRTEQKARLSMSRKTLGIAFSAVLLAGAFALAGTSVANAESVMKICGDQWKAAKAAGTTGGKTWKGLSSLNAAKTRKGAAAPAAPAAAPQRAPAPAPAAPAPAPAAGAAPAPMASARDDRERSGHRRQGWPRRARIPRMRGGVETRPKPTTRPMD